MKKEYKYSQMSSGALYPHTDPANVINDIGGHNYYIRVDEFGNYYLEPASSFVLPDRIYGDLVEKSSRVIKSFDSKDSNTGVLLVGEKGSGKTLLAKHISETMKARGIPTILFTSGFGGDTFNDFMTKIPDPAVILIDEFEKLYVDDNQKSNQAKLLTLLDGVIKGKKLYLLTCNDYSQIHGALLGRPGRIRYAYEYHLLNESFVTDYCRYNLNNKEYEKEILDLRSFYDINFDVLQTIVEECNLFNESPTEVCKHINICKSKSSKEFSVVVTKDNKVVELREKTIWLSPQSLHGEKSCDVDINGHSFYDLTSSDLIFKELKRENETTYMSSIAMGYNNDKYEKLDGWKIRLVQKSTNIMSFIRWNRE